MPHTPHPPAAVLASDQERVFHGLGVSPGIAIGVVFHHNTGTVAVPEYCLTRDGIKPSATVSPKRWRRRWPRWKCCRPRPAP